LNQAYQVNNKGSLLRAVRSQEINNVGTAALGCPVEQSSMGAIAKLMRRNSIFLTILIFLISCSPRDFLTRRLAVDLIAASDEFNRPQQFVLQIGVVSNKDYASPEYLVLQHRGWISAVSAPCPQGLVPPPCWDVSLTTSGVDTVHAIIPANEAGRSSLIIPAAKRELVAITGVSKQGSSADVEFTWKWAPMNEIGGALYSSDVQYKSTVGFRQYDDGWRIIEVTPRTSQSIVDALKNAEPVQ
jgi:hypothetical protein